MGENIILEEMSAALQKCSRVEYWLQLLHESEFLDEREFASMNADNQELFSLLTSIVKTSRSRQQLNTRILNSPLSILHSLADKNSYKSFC